MADAMTTTKTTGPAKAPAKKKDEDPNAAVNDAIEALRDALVDAGMSEAEADVKLGAVKPNETNIVGNFADLQRIGAMLVHETGGIADAVLPPAEPASEAAEASAGVVK